MEPNNANMPFVLEMSPHGGLGVQTSDVKDGENRMKSLNPSLSYVFFESHDSPVNTLCAKFLKSNTRY